MKLKSALVIAALAPLGSIHAGPAVQISIGTGCPPRPVICPPRPVVCYGPVLPVVYYGYGLPLQATNPSAFTNQRIVGAVPVTYQVPAPVFAPAVQVNPGTPFTWRR